MPKRTAKPATPAPDWRGRLMKEIASLYAKLSRAPHHEKPALHKRIAELTERCDHG